MKRIAILAALLAAASASAKLVQKPIMSGVWQIDAEYCMEHYNNSPWMSTLHGNAIYEYQWNNRDPEFLMLTVDGTRAMVHYGVAKEVNGKRVPKERWSGSFGGHGSGTGKFQYPRGICIHPKASDDRYLLVFVADEGNNRVVKLEYDTKKRKLSWLGKIALGSSGAPTDVACQWLDESAGTAVLAIARSGDDKITFYKVNPSGSVAQLTNYGSTGSGEGQFNSPASLTFHKTSFSSGYGYYDLFVADRYNGRVAKIRCIFQASGSSHQVDWIAEKDVGRPIFHVSGVLGAASYCREKVVFIHILNLKKVVAYDWDLTDKLYEMDASRSRYMSFLEGECVLSEQWTYNSGLEYYWLDSQFKEVGAIPNQFAAYGEQDVVINYVLTGGGKVTIKVWLAGKEFNPYFPPVAVLKNNDSQAAGRHYVIWDATGWGPNDYVITFQVQDYYEGSWGYARTIPITITPPGGVSAFYSSFEPGEGSAVPHENSILSNNCADSLWSGVVGAESGIKPHSGSKMYKVTGVDTAYESSDGIVEFTVFNPASYEITEPTYLSYWVCAKEFPNPSGRIIFEGQSGIGTRFRNWENYGRLLDRNSKALDPEQQMVPADGQWRQKVFTLTPMSAEEVSKLFITFQEYGTYQTGRFTVYFDDIQLTSTYPGGKYEWYPEHFATGTGPNHTDGDCNFDMSFSAQNLGQEIRQPCYPWIRLKVFGCGDYQGGSCCECQDEDTVWIKPSPGPGIIMDLVPQGNLKTDTIKWPTSQVDSSTKISWWQLDRAHSLLLGALIKDDYGDTNWLYWAWNADNHWDETGYVNMGDSGHTRKYDEWEFIPERNVRNDYYSEYQAVAEYILSLRVAHYCRSDWSGDKGGIIGDLYLGSKNRTIIDTIPDDSLPDPPVYAGASPVVREPSIDKLEYSGGEMVVRKADGKRYYVCWNPGEGMKAKQCALYLSRDGGETFEHQIADSLSPGTKQPLDTIIIDDTLETIRYVLHGKYEWQIASPPTSSAQLKLVVTDSSSNTYEYLSNLFQIHIPSALFWPLQGNAPLVAVYPAMGETHLVWTTWNAEDTCSQDVFGSILYAHSFDGIKWDTLDSPVQGRRPAICLTSWGKPVIIYNDTAGGVYVSGRNVEDAWYSTDITPFSSPGADFTANPVMWLGDTIHFTLFARMDTATLVLYAKEKYPILGGITNLYTLGTYPDEPEADYAPSIALDRDGLPHIAYRMADTTYYAHFTGSAWVTDNFPSDTTCHPSVACVDGNVYILYRNPDKKLARKLGYLDGPLTSEQVVTATTGDILDPRLVGGSVVVFTDNEDTSARKVRFAQYDSEVNGFSYPVPITDVERNAYSPQGIFLSDTSLWLMWTEDRESHNKIAYQELDPLYEIPCCELDAGWDETPYTSHRDTTASYGEVTVDVGVDSLTYAYTEMDNSERHTVLLEFFFEDDSVQSTNYIVVCGSEVDTLEIEEGYVNQFFYGLSSGYSAIPVKVYAADSIPAQLARTVIYETRGAGGMGLAGVRGKIAPIPVRFALYQNAPNPFVSSTTIRYALPYACHVNLSVYDVAGRRGCVLHKGEQKAGLYTMRWNGKDNHNVRLAAGVYFIRFEADDYVESKKAVLLR